MPHDLLPNHAQPHALKLARIKPRYLLPKPGLSAGEFVLLGSCPEVARPEQVGETVLANAGVVKAVAYNQPEVFEAGALFARTEGILPAPESAHAIKATIDEARRCKQQNKEKVILFNLCGHGILDIEGYREYFAGKMKDNDADPAELKRALDEVKGLYPWLQGSD